MPTRPERTARSAAHAVDRRRHVEVAGCPLGVTFVGEQLMREVLAAALLLLAADLFAAKRYRMVGKQIAARGANDADPGG